MTNENETMTTEEKDTYKLLYGESYIQEIEQRNKYLVEKYKEARRKIEELKREKNNEKNKRKRPGDRIKELQGLGPQEQPTRKVTSDQKQQIRRIDYGDANLSY